MAHMYNDAGDYGYPMVELDSDEDFGEKDSSEDDLDIILHGTPEQKRRLRRISLGQNSSSEDEFEKEMGEELTEAMNKLRDSAKVKESPSKPEADSDKSDSKKQETQFYKNDYFDSDSDEDQDGNSAEKKKTKHPVIADEDLFYDPDMDRQDELWVEGQRGYKNPGKQKKGSKKNAGMKTDAVLNCPACMSLLCLDCQRHDIYKNQYRAMFVKNCLVNMAEKLRYPIAKNKKKRKKVQLKSPLEDLEAVDGSPRDSVTMVTDRTETVAAGPLLRTDKEEVFYPVKCAVCSSEVGVYDEDEVYHFFNVLARHA